MKKLTVMIGAALLVPTVAGAGPVTIPNTFQANTPAVAADVNENFDAVKGAVDDNDARITGLETSSGTCAGNDPTDIMVQVGPFCVDKYEASVWDSAAGGTPLSDGMYGCAVNGGNCANIFARSQAGAIASSEITWFQAAAACANVGKRLPANSEWQVLAMGTVEAGCNVASDAKAAPVDAQCETPSGVNNPVGNVWEWVADWIQGDQGNATGSGGPDYGEDLLAGVNPATIGNNPVAVGGPNFPGALIRGGGYDHSAVGEENQPGVYALRADVSPAAVLGVVGFRCVR